LVWLEPAQEQLVTEEQSPGMEESLVMELEPRASLAEPLGSLVELRGSAAETAALGDWEAVWLASAEALAASADWEEGWQVSEAEWPASAEETSRASVEESAALEGKAED
jgi:hypothetical protein